VPKEHLFSILEMITLPPEIEQQKHVRENALGICPRGKLRLIAFNINPNIFSAQKSSGML
jgi:hypothetical protein